MDEIDSYLKSEDAKQLTRTREALKKVLLVLVNEPSLLKGYFGNGKFTIQNVANMSCNHFFDDHPEKFGIEKVEGHIIREYWHNVPEKQWQSEIGDLFSNITVEERCKQLSQLDLKYNDLTYIKDDFNVDWTEIICCDNAEFNKILLSIKSEIKKRKNEKGE